MTQDDDGRRARTAAVVVAAGSGSRLGREMPKALVPLLGRPLVTRAVEGVLAADVVGSVVVVVPPGQERSFADALALLPEGGAVVTVPGGATRQASVAAGLAALDDAVDVVLVHDAARCLQPPDVVRRVAAEVHAGAAVVVPVVPVTDSVVTVAPEVRPLDRATLRAVQTPQGFDVDLLRRAHAAAHERSAAEATAASDDATLCAALGVGAVLVDGHADGLKITTERDLALAQVLLRERRAGGAV